MAAVSTFDIDVYKTDFEAVIIKKGADYVVLNKTYFFPEGGGQSSDIGFINGIRVLTVIRNEGEIKHYLEDATVFEIGQCVSCTIDFNKRFSDMQNHSGEHIVSGLVHKYFGFDNVGFHLNDNEVALDFNGVLTEENIRFIELQANKAVWKNIDIKIIYPSDDEIGNYDFRSKIEIENELRLVEIEGVDLCACCAPHVKKTGEIGVIKIIGFEKHRGGVRVYILCGERALNDYNIKEKQNKQTGVLLKVPEYETYSAVTELLEKKKQADYDIISLKNRAAELTASQFNEEDVIFSVCDFTGKSLTYYANILKEKCKKYTIVFGKVRENEYQYIILSKGAEIASTAHKINDCLNGRGGGKGLTVQGSVKCTKDEIMKVKCEFI